MAFTRLLRSPRAEEGFGPRVVPIIPDEARTFGMDSLFREVKIYAHAGQRYEPVDHNLLLAYLEAKDGQLLEEGITEAGLMASFTAAGHRLRQPGRADGALLHLLFDVRLPAGGRPDLGAGRRPGPGLPMGATAGRTTLLGEGLQHQDGHSPLVASSVPPCQVYDPAFAYELALIIQDGVPAHVRERRGHLLLPDRSTTRTTSCRPLPRTSTGRGCSRGLYRWRRRRRSRAR